MIRTRRILFVALLVHLATGCTETPLQPLPVGPSNGWSVFHPIPGGYDLEAVWSDGPGNVWAVGSHGVVVHWDGESVVRVDSPVSEALYHLTGQDPADLYAAGGPHLLHYDGRTWEVFDRFPHHIIQGLLVTPEGRLYVTGTRGLLLRESDGWTVVEGPTIECGAIWLADDGVVRVGDLERVWRVEADVAVVEQEFADAAVGGGDGALLWLHHEGARNTIHRRSDDAGWTLAFENLTGVDSLVDAGRGIWVANGDVFHGDDWAWPNAAGRWLDAVVQGLDGGLLACGYGGSLIRGRFVDDAIEWTDSALDLGFRHINDLCGYGRDDFWAAEWWNRVLHYDAGTWTLESANLPSNEPVSRVHTTADGNVGALGGGRVSVRQSGGFWRRLPFSGEGIQDFWAASSDSALSATLSGFHVLDGWSWRLIAEAPGYTKRLAALPSGTVFTVSGSTETVLARWNGTDLDTVARIPGFVAEHLCASHVDEVLWIACKTTDSPRRAALYRYADGVLTDVTPTNGFAAMIDALSELRSDDLFVLDGNQVRRYVDGRWRLERGLPANESFLTLWASPDGGVFVEGHPTFFKDFSGE